MDLKNSTILITGGTSGMGLEFVKQLTEIGAKIIVTGRNLEALYETKKQFPNVHTFQSDVSNPKDIKDLFDNVTTLFPDLNIIINNAGMMRLIDLQDQSLDLENINREIATNLTGTIQMVHQFLPHLFKQKSAGIVNVSSGIAFMSYSPAPIYSATKAGIRAYTQALRLQLENTNVKVFEMIPPGVKTNLQNDWVKQPNPAMMMNADEMVKISIDGLLKDKKELKPFPIRIIKLATRLMPNVLLNIGHREFREIKKLKSK
ncbi:SDR family NAD(P)-dependent oxidoreductase [Chryseobacterium sp. 09-1422]|uniref:SDR family NAD(P)-dependent oxidoreductase n=1 Tax=Chryseobacterium kimseyorum TaxID=2984028 RepID=A0ABT3I0X1_9FLAO|nr:SDR family NAD(P)-dependent oxidoreductase [Chryseobacterium kimseyorum]MCW3169644.1 SDR family NAD(P)-dependent oxidoreductase [Chryseobacterium kimseyorum]